MLRYLLDTNVLIYPHQAGDPAKSERALAVLAQLGAAQNAALPAQALAEFANVALKKLRPPMAPSLALAQVERLVRTFPVLPLSPATVLEAIRGVRDHGLSYYDAQIWAVAKLGQIETILSEDFNTGAVIEGVAFTNPFAPSFSVDDLR